MSFNETGNDKKRENCYLLKILIRCVTPKAENVILNLHLAQQSSSFNSIFEGPVSAFRCPEEDAPLEGPKEKLESKTNWSKNIFHYQTRQLSSNFNRLVASHSLGRYCHVASCFFADDWIRTADLWHRKLPTYQLSHNHCPSYCFISISF